MVRHYQLSPDVGNKGIKYAARRSEHALLRRPARRRTSHCRMVWNPHNTFTKDTTERHTAVPAVLEHCARGGPGMVGRTHAPNGAPVLKAGADSGGRGGP